MELEEWSLPLAFNQKRHLELISGCEEEAEKWRMKERMKTVSVALVLCLNVGVDPPDIVKTQPCARLECWIDPLSMPPQKALETIGANLQRQYERWQSRARYKQCLDPTVEEVKKLCTSLRRNAKEERVLFHYNGHGVPKPTVNGELWVFNKSFTQYIPLSVYDLQQWMGTPSIYVYDCSCAGIIVDSFKQFASQREQELATLNGRGALTVQQSYKNCIQLAACAADQILPMNPDLPADLFTSCLTTPIRVALRWFVVQNSRQLVPNVTLELIEKIPGQLNDRRTMLGELNWIFTAITDTIAWNTLPRELFQKLFRQDLVVASLFRNFLLAERIMRSYSCTPISHPKLPSTHQHHMWQAWDLALDICLSQLPDILNDSVPYRHSLFFAEQLTAFQVWLSFGSQTRNPPEQLPIVLQVLLSQVHRLRALELLGRFLDLGPWAVSLALSVGIFPYVLKLLQSSARELRPLLVFIWAKILAVDTTCQADLVKDNGHKYFLSVLADPCMPAEHRTMAAFVLAIIVNCYPQGQEAVLQGNLISLCLEQLSDFHPLLRQWLCICLGRIWTDCDAARGYGVRDNAHIKLYPLLTDDIPEVRAAAVHSLGTFLSNTVDRTDHANTIDHGIGMQLIAVTQDGSPLVRMELVVAYQGLVMQFEHQFSAVAAAFMEEESHREGALPFSALESSSIHSPSGKLLLRGAVSVATLHPSGSKGNLLGMVLGSSCSPENSSLSEGSLAEPAFSNLRHVLSSSAIAPAGGLLHGNVYSNIWRALLLLTNDPYPEVAELARTLTGLIKQKASLLSHRPRICSAGSAAVSAPGSPLNRSTLAASPPNHIAASSPTNASKPIFEIGEASPKNPPSMTPHVTVHSAHFARTRKMFDTGPEVIREDAVEEATPVHHRRDPVVTTEFIPWCCKYFSQPVMKLPDEHDPESESHHQRHWRLDRNTLTREEGMQQARRALYCRLDDQVFINKNIHVPACLKFHPYESLITVADKDGVSTWNWEHCTKQNYFYNKNPRFTQITTMETLNGHDDSLLLTGTDDGSVRVWKNYAAEDNQNLKLVTAWQALSDMLPSSANFGVRNTGSGMVTAWEQETGMLYASGDVRVVRIWDTQRELKVQDIPTQANSCITSLAVDSANRSLLVAGCGDGLVRLYDRRLSPAESLVLLLREHNSWVINVHVQQRGDGKIISGSVGGDVKMWDPRFSESVMTIHTSHGLTAMDVHQYADLIACGSVNQYISIYNMMGDCLSTVKYHEGFMGQRIGPISCLAFHPYKLNLGAGYTDYFVSVYTAEKKR